VTKRTLFLVVSFLLFITVQIVILQRLSIMDVTPDLILTGVAYFSLKYGSVLGIPIGFFLG